MKILLINNYHFLRDGAARAYFSAAEILEDRGHEVAFFSTKNKKNLPTKWEKYFVDAPDFSDLSLGILDKIKIIFNIFCNWQAKKNLEELIKEFKPDVAHLHNIYHHISPSVINVLKKNNIPTVMTLHDYKLVCPNYNLFVRGKIWEGSKPDKYWRCLTDKCVKNSYLKSLVCTIEAYWHKAVGVYKKIDVFISPSYFLIKKFKEFGFKEKINYLPNPFIWENKNFSAETADKYILYYGRLSEEKGIGDLLKAYAKLPEKLRLKIVGDGPLAGSLKSEVAGKKILGVDFLGHLENESLQKIIAGAEFVVVPSRWYENAPYSVVEPLAMGKIVLASRLGGLAELIKDGQNGFTFEAGDVENLASEMRYLVDHPELKEKIRQPAMDSVAANSPKEYYLRLMEVYKEIFQSCRNPKA